MVKKWARVETNLKGNKVTLNWKLVQESNFMHFTTLTWLRFLRAQYFSVCEKFYERDSKAKSRFSEFGFS